MNRRNFFRQLASGLIVAAAPNLFIPKLIKPVWKVQKGYMFIGTETGRITSDPKHNIQRLPYGWREYRSSMIITWQELDKDGLSFYENLIESEREAT